MGKVRAVKRDFKKSLKHSNFSSASSSSESQLKTTMGKISEEISAINLGLPRKILKKTNNSSNSNSLVYSNFASRVKNLNKQKKKVTFCQNLIAEDLKEQRKTDDESKHYFKVIHPSALEKRKVTEIEGKRVKGVNTNTPTPVKSLIPDDDALLSSSMPALRKIIKKSVKNKKLRLKATKETFKKKMALLKLDKDQLTIAKQRQQTVIVGDMNPLLESLPVIATKAENEVGAIKQEEKNRLRIPKKTEKYSVKKTQQAMLESLRFFEASGVGQVGVTAGVSTQ